MYICGRVKSAAFKWCVEFSRLALFFCPQGVLCIFCMPMIFKKHCIFFEIVLYLFRFARNFLVQVMEDEYMSDFLFSNPSFIDGVMSVVDLFGVAQEYNDSRSPNSADSRAIRADTNAVKKDFADAYKSMVAEYA